MSIEKKSLISTLKTAKKVNTVNAPEASHVSSKMPTKMPTKKAHKKPTKFAPKIMRG